MLVTRRAAPVDAAGRLAREKAPVLPEILARAGALATVQAVDHGRGDAAGLEDEARHGFRERARLPARMLRGLDLVLVRLARRRHALIRCAP
jgi:hypothetical protein